MASDDRDAGSRSEKPDAHRWADAETMRRRFVFTKYSRRLMRGERFRLMRQVIAWLTERLRNR